MRYAYSIACILMFAATLFAQEPSEALRHAGWNRSVWVGGGTGLGTNTGAQFMNAGFRIGRVLTRERGSGPFRGTFEYALDVIPAFPLHFEKWVYGGGMAPVVLKWNFTKSKRLVPYGEVSGGFLIHTENVPAGDTSQVNFVEGIGGGMHVFTRPKHAWFVGGKVFHFSNASLGRHNPGVNTSLQLTLGYMWMK
jgi:lipid A 3-O-deacylase